MREFCSFWSKKCDEYMCMRISFQVGQPSNWELKRLPLQMEEPEALPKYIARKASSKTTFCRHCCASNDSSNSLENLFHILD